MNLFDFLFGCGHDHRSRIFSNYERCLDCGSRRRYDLQRGLVGAWAKERPEPVFKLEQVAAGERMFSRIEAR